MSVIKISYWSRLIRLNSPNLNYLVIAGMILLYCGGIGFVIPATDHQAVPPICLVAGFFHFYGRLWIWCIHLCSFEHGCWYLGIHVDLEP